MMNTIFLIAATWITALAGQGEHRPALRLARDFAVAKPVRRATLEATALGLYKPFVNGREVTDRRLMPGWTQYDARVLKQSFDVTPYLKEGTNTLAALVGRGWFCGMISSVGVGLESCGWRRHPAFWAELTLEYEDGARETVGTDRSWKSAYLLPALLENDIYLGEEYDATFDDTAWKLAGGADSAVSETTWPGAIVPEDGQPVRTLAVLKPQKIVRKPSGKIVLDYGENLSGVDRVTLKAGHPGATIVIRHGEILDADGDIWRDNLVFARQETRLTCGKGPLVYEPSFTFYGYRYAEVSGWPADEPFDETSVQAVKISSVGRRTGTFRCSNELVNRFYANVLRSQEDNFVDVPTDCPQRCERFGWTGDAQVFSETAMMNYDVRGFFRKWIADLNALADHSGGAFTTIAPYHTEMKPKSETGGPGSAGWADAGVVCPWMLYRKYGDRAALERSVGPIERYVDLQDSVPTPPTIGDHLALGKRKTNSAFVSEALRIEMMRLAILVERTFGRDAQARHFAERRAARLAEFRAKWFDADGELKERTQTSAAFAIVYGLAPGAAAREKARQLLVAEIRAYDTHLTTGFLGTPVLLRALTESGETALAYELLEQKTCPSWLYPVTMGATSIWERWDAIRPDGTHHPNWMNSFNHYAFGSAASWLYDTVCGIRDVTEEDPSAAGFRRFRLAPQPGGTLTEAEATLETAYGTIRSAWRRTGGKTIYEFTVPAGTTAELVLPGEKPRILKPGTHQFGGANAFRVTPYVQRPAPTAMTIMWLAQTNGSASVTWCEKGGAEKRTISSATERADLSANVVGRRFGSAVDKIEYCAAPELDYDANPEKKTEKLSRYGAWEMPYTRPYQYRVRLTGLKPDTTYDYTVTLADGPSYSKTFRTPPAADPASWKPLKFIYYSDSETEPRDNDPVQGLTKDWTDPVTEKERTYYATQTEAYAKNVQGAVDFGADLIIMAGDLAQQGSRQCDWDEFWRHNAGPLNDPAGSRPILAAPGNHDYTSYADGGECGMRKFLSYFEFEPNGAAVDDDQAERFHRVDYGPCAFIFLDANNGIDGDLERDTNCWIDRGPNGCHAPDFNPGSAQYKWLEAQLADAQKTRAFTFIVSHQCPFSVGYHGRENSYHPSKDPNGEALSGQPLRVLLPLMHKYGVDGWFAGHDEMMERSVTTDEKTGHSFSVWDMGIAGDGLRGNKMNDNANERFRASVHAPEVYEDGVLVAGGKHYGHLQVTIDKDEQGRWRATFDPVYVFYSKAKDGTVAYGGLRHYDDRVVRVSDWE